MGPFCRALATYAVCAAVAFATGCSTDPERAKVEYVKSGDQFVAQQKYAEAIVQYRNALQHDAKYGEARLKLARAHEAVGDAPNAFREYVRAADALPASVDAQVKAATYLLRARQFEQARIVAERAQKLDPRNVEALVLLGNALGGLRKFDEALGELEQAMKLDPGSTQIRTTLGMMQMAKGDSAEAEAAFRKAIAADPANPDGHLALGAFLWADGRQNAAEGEFKQALALKSDNATVRRALASFYLANNRAREAESHLQFLADSDTSASAPWKVTLADYYVIVNRPDAAMKVLEGLSRSNATIAMPRIAAIKYAREDKEAGRRTIDELLARDPKNVPALLVKARFFMDEGKLDEALSQAEAAAQAEPQSIQARYLIGLIRRAQRRPDQAIEAFNEVLRINPSATAAQMQLAELSLMRGKPDQALQLASEASQRIPDDFRVQLTVVQALAAAGHFQEAQAKVAGLLKAAPGRAEVQAAAGTVAFAKRDAKAARAYYVRAGELDPKNFVAFSGLVSLDLLGKRTAEAKSRIERQLVAQPTDPEVLIFSARVFGSTGDLPRAEQLLAKVVEVDPSNLQAYSMLGRLYATQRRLPQARASYETLLRQRPDSIGAQTIVAVLYEVEGNNSEARKRYESILKTNPQAAVASNNLAYLYAEEGSNLEAALQLAETAKQALPENADVADTLGWIYVKKDLPDLAIRQLEEATRKNPENGLFQYHLGVAYAKAGDPARAKKTLERALALKLDPAKTAEANKILSAL